MWFERTSLSLPAPQLLSSPLCFTSSVLRCLRLMFSCTKATNPGHKACALRTNTKWLSTWNCSFPWTFAWPLALFLKKMTHPPSVLSDPTWLNPSQLWHFHAVTTGFLIWRGPTVPCILVEQVFWVMNLQFQHLLYVHPSVMLQLYGTSKFRGF